MTAACLLAAAAAVVNAGFESGETGWTLPKDAWSVSATGGRDGSACAVWDNRDPKAFSYAYQNLELEPGVSYEFGAWTKVEDGKVSPHVILGWCDASNKWISCEFAELLQENDPTTKGWVRHEGRTQPLPAAARRGLFHFHMSRGETGRAKFDSFWIRPCARVVVPYLVTSAFRNAFAHGDGPVRFWASLNLNAETTPPETLLAELVFRDAQGGTSVRTADTFDATAAVFSVPADAFALGKQEVLFRLRTKADGKVFAEKRRAVEVTDSPKARRVRFDRAGRLLVDGRRTLPIGCFSGALTPAALADLRKGPFNFAMPYGLSSPETMSLAHSNGVWVVPCVMNKVAGMKYQMVNTKKMTREQSFAFFRDYVGKVRGNPGLLAYFIIDELPRTYVPNVAEVNDLLQELDPDHPTWAVTDKPTHAGDLLPCYDFLAMDPYPVGNRGARADISICSGWTRQARAGIRDFRPMWIVPQAFDWSWYRPEDRGVPGVVMPTRAEMANMTWQGVAAGANGVCFYSYGSICRFAKPERKADYWEDVCAVAREVKAAEDVLLAEDTAADSGAPETLEVRSWRLDGRDWVLAVNRTREPVKATLSLPRTALRLTAACGGGVSVRDGRLEVDFAGLGYALVSVEGR